MENEELIKLCSDKAQKWLTPAYDAETQAEVKRMLENPDKTELIEAFYKRPRIRNRWLAWYHGSRFKPYEYLYCWSCNSGIV